MKKLISLLLVIIITCSVLSGCVYFDKDLKMKKAYLDQFEIKDKNPEDVIVDYDSGTYNGARIVMLDAEWHDPEEWTEIIGETKLQYYDSNRLYAYKDGHFITLTQAFENSILKKSDVQEIARDFNDKVTHYRDTCDKFDFVREGRILEIHENNKPYIKYGALLICIDDRLIGDYSLLIEYLGADMISDLFVQFPYIDLHIEGKYSRFYVILKYDTKEYTEYVMKKIVKTPGVYTVELYFGRNVIAGIKSQSDTPDNQSWWIDDINVEKIWDFSTGSKEVSVGVIDMGIATHSQIGNNLSGGYDFLIIIS